MLFGGASKRDLGLYNFPLFSSEAASSVKSNNMVALNLTPNN